MEFFDKVVEGYTGECSVFASGNVSIICNGGSISGKIVSISGKLGSIIGFCKE